MALATRSRAFLDYLEEFMANLPGMPLEQVCATSSAKPRVSKCPTTGTSCTPSGSTISPSTAWML